jgi:hypothetical protein
MQPDTSADAVRPVKKVLRGGGKATFTGDDIASDALIRLERQTFFPPERTGKRQLFVSVSVSCWLVMYPCPPEENEVALWEEASRFTDEEHRTFLLPLEVIFFDPLVAYAVTHLGQNVYNSPVSWGDRGKRSKCPTWVIIASSSVTPTEADVERVANAGGLTVAEVRELRLEKHANLGAALIGPVDEDDVERQRSPWINKAAGCFDRAILGVLRWKFDANGPSAMFKNLDELEPPNGISILEQRDAPAMVTAVQKKLRKGKVITVMDPATGERCEERKHVRAKRRGACKSQKQEADAAITALATD